MSRPIIAAEIQYSDSTASPNAQTAYLASEAFCTADSDILSGQYFAGRLDGDLTYSLKVSTVFWSGKSTIGVGSVDIINDDGGLDGWLNHDFRDQTITIKQHIVDTSYDDATTLLTAIIDRIEIVSEKRLRVVIRDPAAELLTAMQTVSYTSGDADGQLKPVCFGDPRNVPPVLTSASALSYDITDDTVLGINAVYDQGVEVDFNPSTTGFSLIANPAGKITADPITSGTGNDPTISIAPTEYELYGAGRGITMLSSAGVGVYGFGDVQHTRDASSGGKYYFELTVDACKTPAQPSGSNGTFGGDDGNLAFGLASATIANPQSPKSAGFYCMSAHQYAGLGTTIAGYQVYGNDTKLDSWTTNDGTLTPLVGETWGCLVDFDSSPMTISFRRRNAAPDAVFGPWGIPDGTYAPVAGNIRGSDYLNQKCTIKLIEDDFVYSIPSGYTAWSEGVTANTGFQTLCDAIATRVGVTFDTDSPSTVGAIDSLGYTYAYYYAGDPVTAGDVLTAAMGSIGGFWYVSRLAEIKVGQLKTVADSFLTLTDVELLDTISLVEDMAPGLSDGIGSKKNWTVHRESEVAGSVSESRKAAISRDYQTEYRTTTTMAGNYTHASGAKLHDTLLTTDADASGEADRFAELYSENRKLWTVKIAMTTGNFTNLLDNIGNGVILNIDRFGLGSSVTGAYSSGFETLAFDVGGDYPVFSLVGVEGAFLKNEITLLLWG